MPLKQYQKRIWALGFLSTLLMSCAVGPQFKRPDLPVMAADSGTRVQAGPEPYLSSDRWWESFQSDWLNQAMTEVLKNNVSVSLAQSNLSKAQFELKAGYGLLMPHIGVSANVTRNLTAPLPAAGKPVSGLYNVYTASSLVSFNLDIWGSSRRTIEALGAEVDIEQAQWQASRLAVGANAANTLMTIAAIDTQLPLAEQMVELTKKQSQSVKVQVQSQLSADTVYSAQQVQLAAAESSLADLRSRSKQARALLAKLSGQLPQSFVMQSSALGSLQVPAHLPRSVNSTLARVRPDILMAEGQMHVASAQIGIATAALLPSINLAGNDGHAANDTATLTDATQRAWAGVGEVDVPIFQGGQLWFTRQAAKQAYQSAWLNYRLVVLTAFEQVEDAFSVLDQDQIGYASAAASKESAQALATAANAQFKAGVMSATEQEQAQINYLNACMVEIDKRVQLLQDVTMLSVALGGVEFQ